MKRRMQSLLTVSGLSGLLLAAMLFVTGCAATTTPKHYDDPGVESGQQQSHGGERTVPAHQ